MNVNPRDKYFGITPLTGHDEAIKKIKEKIALQKDYIDLPFQTSKESRAVDMGNKVKFNLKNGVCLPFASNIFLEPWVKEYYSNLIQQYDRNVFYIHLIDSMASMEKYDILDTTLSWAHCNESSDVWIDRNRKFNEKYD